MYAGTVNESIWIEKKTTKNNCLSSKNPELFALEKKMDNSVMYAQSV